MRTRSTIFLTRLANVASLALAVQLGMAAPAMFTLAPLWLHLLLLGTVAGAALTFPMAPPRRTPWLPDALLTVFCALQQVLWLAFAPAELASTLPWSWAIWLSASIVVTFRHGRWFGVLFALLGVLSYPLSLAVLGHGFSGLSAVALLTPLFVTPAPPMFDQLRRELDDLRAATLSSVETSTSAADASRRLRSKLDSRQAFAAFVHDNVLGTLAAAANATAEVGDRLRELAGRALEGLRSSDAEETGSLTRLRDFHDELEAAAVGSGATWAASLHRDAMPTVPAELAHDFTEAFRQAAENSVRHADAGIEGRASRSARLTATRDLLEVQYRDDGPGFLLAEIPGNRLGLRGSILRRIERHESATALVDTRPGSGTTVTLRWRPLDTTARSAPAEAPVSRERGGASALVVFWLISVAISLTTINVQPHPLWTATANLLVGAGAVCLAAGMRLTTAVTWSIATLPLLTSLLLLPQATPWMPKWQFTLDAASLLCAYLIVRGRVIPGLFGYASMGAIGLSWAWSHGGFHTLQGPRWLPTILIGVALVWWWRLRRESAAVLALRREEAHALRQLDAASASLEGVEQQRQWVEAAAREILEEIADTASLTSDQRERARLVEARIRDRMRSPALASGALEVAVSAARARGAVVSVLDDAAHTGRLPRDVMEQLVAALLHTGSGDVVTVRRAPTRPVGLTGSGETPPPVAVPRVSVFVQPAHGPGTLSFVGGAS